MSSDQTGYLLAGKASELERLRLQSRVWDQAGRDLLRLPVWKRSTHCSHVRRTSSPVTGRGERRSR
jgi:hypothetical protein